jgi:tight adherence protein C
MAEMLNSLDLTRLLSYGSPGGFGFLVGLTVLCFVLALRPAAGRADVRERLDGYSRRPARDEAAAERRPSFLSRVVIPLLGKLAGLLGRLAPGQALDDTQRRVLRAGLPGGLGALDFQGLRMLLALALGTGALIFTLPRRSLLDAAVSALAAGLMGLILPSVWLNNRIEKRSKQIARALPNALDMLTVGVEAGLGFDSALIRVAEQWDNALTEELRYTVLEMQVGTPRNVALQNLAERCNVPDLKTFVAVLVQSSELGVSIADVLHSQAAQMRHKRRQSAEATARRAGVKMTLPLVLLIMPALFVIILGPAVPRIMSIFASR